MKYFVDIECNQYTDDIIAIAVENENYESYSTLIKPTTKITPFITHLTGITNEQVQNAPPIGVTFKKLIAWTNPFNDDDQFYFYGNEDEIVLKKTLHKITNQDGINLLTHVLNHIVDYSLEVKSHFGVVKPIALIKIVEYYRKERVFQSHNALEDAQFLHYTYTKVTEDNEPVDTNAFAEYKTEQSLSTNTIVRMDDDGKIVESYNSISEALSWIISEAKRAGRQLTDRQSVRGKLAHSIKFNTKYYGYYWGKVGKHLNSLDIQ